MYIEHHGGIELRWTKGDGTDYVDPERPGYEFDEFVVHAGGMSVHGERMSDGYYWIGLSDGDRMVHVDLHAKRKNVLYVTTRIEQQPDRVRDDTEV